jgi:hypothetical protein
MLLRHYQHLWLDERYANRWFRTFFISGGLLFIFLLALALCVGVVIS